MTYMEIIAKALKGRSVNATASAWGLKQRTLDRYVKGEQLPDYQTAKKIADDAEISYGQMLTILADEEERRKAITPQKFAEEMMVERRRIELPTFALRTRRSPS